MSKDIASFLCSHRAFEMYCLSPMEEGTVEVSLARCAPDGGGVVGHGKVAKTLRNADSLNLEMDVTVSVTNYVTLVLTVTLASLSPARLQPDDVNHGPFTSGCIWSYQDLLSTVSVSTPSFEPSNYCNILITRDVGGQTRTHMSIIHGKVLG